MKIRIITQTKAEYDREMKKKEELNEFINAMIAIVLWLVIKEFWLELIAFFVIYFSVVEILIL